ncbi:MAG TPA: hypothetical protein VK855_04350, partial [Thioalkalivibrio sp.]|nr:hypothetical protein [Thioalkalivibrio sp.]
MIRLLLQTAATIIANAVGLLLAAMLLTGFTIDPLAFVVVLLVFTGVLILTGPLMTKIAITSVPQIRGSVALVTVFVGLKVTEWLMGGFDMGGLSNWLAATLLVWLGSLIAQILIPIYVFKQLR